MISQKELKLFRIEFRQFLKVNCTNISSDPFLDKTHGMACFYDNMKKKYCTILSCTKFSMYYQDVDMHTN